MFFVKICVRNLTKYPLLQNTFEKAKPVQTSSYLLSNDDVVLYVAWVNIIVRIVQFLFGSGFQIQQELN